MYIGQVGNIIKAVSGYVYVLKSIKNGRFYIGSTSNYLRRIEEHKNGKSKYTSDSGSVEEVFVQKFDSLTEARKIEKWLKDSKSRKLIEEIVMDGLIKKKL